MHPSDFSFIFGINLYFDTLEKYIFTLEESILTHHSNLKANADRLSGSGSEVPKVFDVSGDEAEFIFEHAPRLVWESAFVLIYSNYEYHIVNIAARAWKRFKQGHPGMRKPGRLLTSEDAFRCLKGAGITLPSQQSEIECFNHIRNIIAHSLGSLNQDRRGKIVEEYYASREADGREGFKVRGKTKRTLQLSPDFCREAISIMRSFLSDVVSRLPTP